MKYRAKIISGWGRGRQIGFPTLNLIVPKNFGIDFGVYSARVWLDKNEYIGAMHFGPIPTFDEKNPALEIHLLDYSGDIVVDELVFEPVEKIREIKKFSQRSELREQIKKDIEAIKTSLGNKN